jgi:hypothetical protein
MIKHYVIEINPEASYEWERCTIRNPIDGNSLDLKSAIATAVGNQPGSYLIALKLEVEILEQSPAQLEPLSSRPIASLAVSSLV